MFNENKNKKMAKEPKLPHKLKWGDSAGNSDVFMKKPRVGAYYKYIKLKDIAHEES